MKIAICDDEKHYCKQIQECVEIYLDKHHIYGKTEIFMDGNALLEKGMLAEFDALFLDVEFGGKAQGMKIAREVHQRNAMLPIVFVSAFIKYSVEGYRVNALRYLLKNAKDLQKEIEESMDTVLSVYTQRQKKKTFRFRGETVTLLLDQIMYIERKAHQLFFYLCDDTCRCMGKRTLDEMQRELTEDEGRFLRIHKSFLVNMNDISTLKRYQVQLFSGKQLPIPRERYAVVEMQYEEWKNRND